MENDLVTLLDAMTANFEALKIQLADCQAAATALAEAKYTEGFAAGVASVVIPEVPVESEKTYKQSEVDQMVADAVAPVSTELESVKGELETLKTELETVKAQLALQNAPIEEQIAAAVEKEVSVLKSNLLAAYQSQQVVETGSETGFADMLK